MRNHGNGKPQGPLDEVLGGVPHVRILRYLSRVGGDHTGRAIGRAVQVSHPVVHRVMRTLAERQVVHAVRHGAAIAYRLNQEHWLVQSGLAALFEAETAFLSKIGEAVRAASGVPVLSVIVFGSLARGEAGQDSDLDLMCLTTRSKDVSGAEGNLAGVAGGLQRRFGRRLAVMVSSKREFSRRFRAKDRLVREIVETGWAIAGEPLSEVLR